MQTLHGTTRSAGGGKPLDDAINAVIAQSPLIRDSLLCRANAPIADTLIVAGVFTTFAGCGQSKKLRGLIVDMAHAYAPYRSSEGITMFGLTAETTSSTADATVHIHYHDDFVGMDIA